MNLLKIPLTPAKHLDSPQERPGRIAKVHGIIVQSDIGSALGELFIRPLEMLDRWWGGLTEALPPLGSDPKMPGRRKPPLAMHAGLHVELEDGRHIVAEQLAGRLYEWLVNGLHWTPIEEFRARDRSGKGGWDATIPCKALRQVDEQEADEAVNRLNSIQGRPFIKEDCTAFIARVFGDEKRVFADSPIAHSLGFEFRSGEPAMPLIHRDYHFNKAEEARLRAEALRKLPDPVAAFDAMSIRQLRHRLVITGVCAAAVVAGILAVRESRGRRRVG